MLELQLPQQRPLPERSCSARENMVKIFQNSGLGCRVLIISPKDIASTNLYDGEGGGVCGFGNRWIPWQSA